MPPAKYQPLPARTCACRRPLVDRHDRYEHDDAHCVRCGHTVTAATTPNRSAAP